jgi:hypothetical protein
MIGAAASRERLSKSPEGEEQALLVQLWPLLWWI